MQYLVTLGIAVFAYLVYSLRVSKKSDEKISAIVDKQAEFEEKARKVIDEKSVDELLTASNAALAKRRASEGKPGKK